MHVQMSRVSSNLKNDIRLYPPTQIFLGLRYTPPLPPCSFICGKFICHPFVRVSVYISEMLLSFFFIFTFQKEERYYRILFSLFKHLFFKQR